MGWDLEQGLRGVYAAPHLADEKSHLFSTRGRLSGHGLTQAPSGSAKCATHAQWKDK